MLNKLKINKLYSANGCKWPFIMLIQAIFGYRKIMNIQGLYVDKNI